MIRGVQRILSGPALLVTACLTATGLAGCAADPPSPAGATRTTFFVPGVFGDGAGYDGLRQAVAEGGSTVRTVDWGLPKPLFLGNFSGPRVHAEAETKLARLLEQTPGEIDLVGHSAGCGVILGALARTGRTVGRVVLVAPSVSPAYDLRPALGRAATVDVFYSDRDTIFLKWRCGTFGTYDDAKTPAAGYAGFATTDPRLRQHPYDPAWARLGHDGGHAGGTKKAFVAAVIAPLLGRPLTPPPK